MFDCCCSTIEGDPPEFLVDKIVEARKDHVCCECGSEIKKGERYEKVVGKWDGEIDTIKTCLVCKTIREDLLCSWTYGMLKEDLWECFEVELC